MRDVNMRQSQPRLDATHDVYDGKWARHHLAVGGDADKTKHRCPGEANAFGPR
jgi:hypothetical protein